MPSFLQTLATYCFSTLLPFGLQSSNFFWDHSAVPQSIRATKNSTVNKIIPDQKAFALMKQETEQVDKHTAMVTALDRSNESVNI